MRKLQPGDKVRVKNKQGDGHGTYIGDDPNTGMPQVHLDKVTVDDGEKKITIENAPAYITPGSIRRE